MTYSGKNHFTEKEQACPHCGLIALADGFLDEMNLLREAAGHALNVTSMCRCPTHNSRVGGALSSYHRTDRPWKCCAADISVSGWDGAKRWRFMKIAMSHGFSVALAKTFVHVDLRAKYTKMEPVAYAY